MVILNHENGCLSAAYLALVGDAELPGQQRAVGPLLRQPRVVHGAAGLEEVGGSPVTSILHFLRTILG